MDAPNDEPYHVTIEVENKQCKVRNLLHSAGIHEFRIIDIRSAADGRTRHLVQMPAKQLPKIPRGQFKIQKGTATGRGISGWIDSTGCDICGTILANDSFLISGQSVEDDHITYSFIARDYKAFQRVVQGIERNRLHVKIHEVRKYWSKKKGLTDTQERVLWLALKMGFFAFPRKIDTSELSRRLRIKPSTLSEISRRGMRRLVESYFET